MTWFNIVHDSLDNRGGGGVDGRPKMWIYSQPWKQDPSNLLTDQTLVFNNGHTDETCIWSQIKSDLEILLAAWICRIQD